MKFLGVDVPWWVLALLAAVVIVLVVCFVWSTIVGLVWLILKIIGLIVLALAGIWAYRKFARRS